MFPLTPQQPGVIEPGRAVIRIREGRVLNQLELSVVDSLGEASLTLVNPGKQLGSAENIV